MATIKEIAKACNVSIATVSNVLNNKPGVGEATRTQIRAKAEEMNYTPNHVALNLKLKNTRTIGVIAEDMTIFSMPDIIDGITHYCEEKNYQILLVNLRLFKKFHDKYHYSNHYFKQVHEVIKSLMSKRVNGIIYVSGHERVIQSIPEDLPLPAVMAYGYTQSDRIPSVVVDDVQGAYDITCYALDHEHTKIGVITGMSDSTHTQERLLGYQKALYDHKQLYDPSIVLVGDWTRESGYRLSEELLKNGVTAIFCMNDLMAGGVYDRVREMGMAVGSDISVLGYDNRDVAGYYDPQLTTVALPLHDIGYEASRVIVNMLENGEDSPVSSVYQVRCKLLIRNSVMKNRLKSD